MEKSKGFLVVASKNQNFYTYAVNLIESVKDFYPEAKVCLCTEERFLDGREEIADDLLFCDSHYRAKLWALPRSPYDITMYIDADMDCEHEDVATIWDEMKDYDLVFHELTQERAKYYTIKDFNCQGKSETFRLCGGVALYDLTKPMVKEFLQEWWDLYYEQQGGMWRPEGFSDDTWNNLRDFDQTTLWWLTEKMDKYKDLNIGIFYDDIRWNFFSQYAYEGLKSIEGKDPILRHYSGSLHKDRLLV